MLIIDNKWILYYLISKEIHCSHSEKEQVFLLCLLSTISDMKPHLPLLLRAAVLACIAAFPAVATAAEGSTMHLYFLTGQSNSLGAVKGSPATPDQLAQYASTGQLWNGNMNQSTGALYESQPTWTTVAPQLPSYNGNNCMGPEYGFSYMMLHKGWIDAAAGDGMGVIKASLDGGGNGCWVKGSNAYNSILSSIKSAIDAMRESGAYANISLEGLLYLQGESNTATEAAAAQTRYDDFLRNLKADLAADGYDSSLLVQSVLGEPATWDNPAHAASTTNSTATAVQLKELADERGDIGWVRTRDLSKITSGDSMGVHYDGKSQITIGARYAYAMALQQGKDVGAVRNDNSDEGVSLNNGAAWWNGTAPTANDVVVWDVSSANVADTLSGDLSVKGIVVEDPFRSCISIVAADGATPTLSLGSSGITLQQAGLDIGVNLATTADQTWQLAGGQALAVGSSDHAVTLGGEHTVSLSRTKGSEGTARVELYAANGSANRTWQVGNGVEFCLSSTGDTVAVDSGASVSLGAASGGSLDLASLTLGDNSILHIGGEGSTGNLSVGTLTLGSGSVLSMDILNNSTYDCLSLSQITGDNVSFQFHYGSALTPNNSYTVVRGWGNTQTQYTFNADAGNGQTASLSVVDGNLVLTLAEEKPNYTQDWVSPAATQTITTNGEYNATAAATSTLTNGKTATGNVYFYANNANNSTGDFYGELQDTSVTWVSAIGSISSGSLKTMTGTSHAKVSGTNEITITAVYAAVNATVHAQDGKEGSGSVYVELDNGNATYGLVYGVFNATVDGSVTLVIKDGTVNSYVVGGSMSGNHTIGGGTRLQLEGGLYKNLVLGGSAAATTINNGSKVYIKGGRFQEAVFAGNNVANAVINGGTELFIDGGVFSNGKWVSAGNDAHGGTINGGARLIINGGEFHGAISAAGTGGRVTGGTELIITGGDFSNFNQAIYASGGAAIQGGTKTILRGIDKDNSFAGYNRVLSGGSSGTATIEGTKSLQLEGYTAARVNAQLQAFDTITVTQGSSTSISNSNNSTLGGAGTLSVEGDSTLELVAEGSAWDRGNTTNNTTEATVEVGSTLSKSGATQLTLKSLSGGGDFVVKEGTAVLNSVADFEGTINVSANATAQAVAGSKEAVTYEVSKGGTAQITAAAGNLGTLKGSGLVEMTGEGGGGTKESPTETSDSTIFTMTEGEWTGTVKFNASRTNMKNIDLSHYGVRGATIAFQGAGTHASGYSYLAPGQTVKANLLFEKDANGIGLKLTAGASDATGTNPNAHLIFEGAWTGDGAFQFMTDSSHPVAQQFIFVNDMTGYKGNIVSNSQATFRFGNGAYVGSAVGSATGLGTIKGSDRGDAGNRETHVIINYLGDTHSENSFTGHLNLTKEGPATHTLKAENSYSGTTTVKGGTLALREDGSLGAGTVTLEQAATGLKIGDFATLAAKGTENGTINGHKKVSARGIEGTVAQLARLANISIEALAAQEVTAQDSAFIQHARFENVSMMFGLQTGMMLSHVTFDAQSSACLTEGAGTRSGAVTASDTTIELSAAEFAAPALLAAAGDASSSLTSTQVINSSRFNALTFTDTLTLNDQEGYIAGLFDTNPGMEEVVLNFEGADLAGVTNVTYNGAALPSGVQAGIVNNAVVFSARENVPEPSTATLSLLALAVIAACRRRKEK